jgi:hypothetical protein
MLRGVEMSRENPDIERPNDKPNIEDDPIPIPPSDTPPTPIEEPPVGPTPPSSPDSIPVGDPPPREPPRIV